MREAFTDARARLDGADGRRRVDEVAAGDPHVLSETTGYERRTAPHGQVAIVLAGLAIGMILMGIQLWLLTVALDLYLSGQGGQTWVAAGISGLVFLGGLLVLRILPKQPRQRW